MYNKVKFNINDPQKIWFRNLQTARENKKWSQVKLAKALDTTIDYLIGNDDDLVKSYYELSQKDKDTISMVVEGLRDKNNK